MCHFISLMLLRASSPLTNRQRLSATSNNKRAARGSYRRRRVLYNNININIALHGTTGLSVRSSTSLKLRGGRGGTQAGSVVGVQANWMIHGARLTD